jgi:hypothetical protein
MQILDEMIDPEMQQSYFLVDLQIIKNWNVLKGYIKK